MTPVGACLHLPVWSLCQTMPCPARPGPAPVPSVRNNGGGHWNHRQAAGTARHLCASIAGAVAVLLSRWQQTPAAAAVPAAPPFMPPAFLLAVLSSSFATCLSSLRGSQLPASPLASAYSFFWKVMCNPSSTGGPAGELKQAIETEASCALGV